MVKSQITREQIDEINIKYVPGTNKTYAVSKDGKVYSFTYKMNGKEIGTTGPKGYSTVGLYYGNKLEVYYVHKLVAELFLPNPEHKKYVMHINEDKTDNRVENLTWTTLKETFESNGHNKNLTAAIHKYYANRVIFGNHPVRVKVFDNDGILIGIEPSIKVAALLIEDETGKPAKSNAAQISNIIAGKPGFYTVGKFKVEKATEEEYKEWVANSINKIIEQEIEINDIQCGKLLKIDGVKMTNRRLNVKTGEMAEETTELKKDEKVVNDLK